MLPLAMTSLIATALASPAWLIAPDGAENDLFGVALAIDGDQLVVGAPNHGSAGYLAGVAYTYSNTANGWVLGQTLMPDGLGPYDNFGTAVAVQGPHAIIGWPQASIKGITTGRAIHYLWNGSAWNEVGRLVDPDNQANNYFGGSLAMDGDDLIVGCQLDDRVGPDSGSALIFKYLDGDWVFQQRLVPSMIGQLSWAGRSVAIKDGVAVIGSYLEWQGDVPAAGAAYVFRRDANGLWNEEARLLAADPWPGNYFGYSLSWDGSTLAVGSILNDAPAEDSGAVYLHEHIDGNWTQTKLTPPDIGGEFGFTIAVQGDDMLIGAVYHPGPGIATGAVYRYKRLAGLWTWRGKWLPRPGVDDCFFGASLDVSGQQAAVGAPREFIQAPWTGAVYVRDIGLACNGDVDGDVHVGVNDLLAVVAAWGPCQDCPEDIDGNGHVGTDDILALIGSWGWCH